MSKLEQAWQSRKLLACVLWPVSLLFRGMVALRRLSYRVKFLRSKQTAVPVVVVGNLSVGGTGKSPLTAALVEYFQEMEWRPGIVARGYGGSNIKTPCSVRHTSNPSKVGDEPVMLASATGVPVCVCVDRASAVKTIIAKHHVDIVFSDDGLQHYAMARDAEIVVVDSARGFGNGWMLPAGPLREPLSRLKNAKTSMIKSAKTSVDIVAIHRRAGEQTSGLEDILNGINHGAFQLVQTHVRKVTPMRAEGDFEAMHDSKNREPLSVLSGRTVHAAAGIGDPSRFFRQLERAGVQVIEHPKPDHHVWTEQDLKFNDSYPVVITSKDAVKVKPLMQALTDEIEVYEVCVKAVLSPDLSNAVAMLEDRLHRIYRQSQQGIR